MLKLKIAETQSLKIDFVVYTMFGIFLAIGSCFTKCINKFIS